jgi:hypothetical protein
MYAFEHKCDSTNKITHASQKITLSSNPKTIAKFSCLQGRNGAMTRASDILCHCNYDMNICDRRDLSGLLSSVGYITSRKSQL